MAILFCWCFLALGDIKTPDYRHEISKEEYIAQLKFRLATLHAEESSLRGIFCMNREKSLLFSSMCLVLAMDCFNDVFKFANPNLIKSINFLYSGPILAYFWIRLMKYTFKRGDIIALEKELDALQKVNWG